VSDRRYRLASRRILKTSVELSAGAVVKP
jgi:hypothetical protein